MREMKDSGVEWIGEIPKDWKIQPLFTLYREGKNRNKAGKETNRLSLSYGKIIRKSISSNEGLVPENYNTYNIIDPNDIIIRPTDLQNDYNSLRTGLVTERGIITSAYIDLKPLTNINSSYYHYLLHSYDDEKVFYNMGNGVRQGINYKQFSKLPILILSDIEAERITDYLDSKCSEIDNIIEKQQAIIEKLKEYKSSVITETVTKGLNPNAEMKDSGVEWLKYINQSYEISTFKRYCRVNQGLQIVKSERKPTDGDNRFKYITVKYLNSEDNEYMTEYIENPPEATICKEDDILMARTGATGIVITGVSGCFHNNFFKINYDRKKLLHDYLVYYLMQDCVKKYLILMAGTTTIPDLNHEDFYTTPLIVPNIDEQKKICDFLNKKIKLIDCQIVRKQILVNKLQEYKKSLIYEVVTGKKEVEA